MGLIRRFKRVPYLIQHLYNKITTSIAFVPMLMAIGFFLFTGLMFYMESEGLTTWMSERLPSFLLIQSWDVAQSILTVLVGALISLMVFSFSMVMVLLNNAASNFSPRILPSLISDKFHQIVLGTYLGTITYCLLMAVNMTPNQPKIPLPGFSVLLGISLGIICLFLFVFFIHSISQSVQVGNILESLHASADYNLKEGSISKLSGERPPSDVERWKIYPADRSGYLRSVSIKTLHKICETEELKMQVLAPESKFIFEGEELYRCDKTIDEELEKKILESFILSNAEHAEEDHVIGFKQITEIALKAMSPGINDPGTALAALNYLTILFTEKMKLPEAGSVVIKDKDENPLPTRLWLSLIGFEELLTSILASMRQYSRHDLTVMMKILELLEFLISRPHCEAHHQIIIKREIETLRVDAEEYLTNPADYNKIFTFSKNILERAK